MNRLMLASPVACRIVSRRPPLRDWHFLEGGSPTHVTGSSRVYADHGDSQASGIIRDTRPQGRQRRSM